MLAGAAVGGAVGAAMLLHVQLPGTPWLVAVGLTKLTLLSSGALMAAGAAVQRIARRQEERRLTESS
jgi:hypothetical protein